MVFFRKSFRRIPLHEKSKGVVKRKFIARFVALILKSRLMTRSYTEALKTNWSY